MSAILLVARAEARRRGAALLGLALLIALVGTAVFGSVAGARRSASAVDRFREATEARDGRAFVYALGAPIGEALVAEVGALDGVTDVGGYGIYPTDARFEIDVTVLAPFDDAAFQRIDRPRLTDGRLPDPGAADEVVVSALAVQRLGLRTGDRFRAATFSPEDCAALAEDDFVGFNGPVLDLRIVGEVRVIEELQGGDGEVAPVLIATPAFAAAHADDACITGVSAVARYAADGGPSASAITAAARRAAPDAGEIGAGSIEEEFLDGVASAVDVVVTALVAFALVTGAAGVLALTQAVTRQVGEAGEVGVTLGAIGLTRPERAMATAIPLVAAGAAGAVLGAIGAVAVSPLFPLGVARSAEPDPGRLVDTGVLVVGVPTLVLLVAVTAYLASRHAARRVESRNRTSPVSAMASRAGARPAIVVGLSLADDRGRGRSVIRTAVVGAAVAVAGVCAVAILAASLTDVLDRPDRFGWPWTAKPDLDSEDPLATVEALTTEEDLTAVGVLSQASLSVEDEGVEGFALDVAKGSIDFPVLHGRSPQSATEIALAEDVLADVAMGETVTTTTARGSLELIVVGRVVLPQIGSSGANSALVLPEAMAELTVNNERSLVLTYRSGVDADQLEARLLEEYDPELSYPTYARPNPPGRLLHLDEIRPLLTALAAFFALLGLAGLAHALMVSTRRNRGFFAALRSLGFERGQVVRSVMTCSLVIVGISAIIGVPLGVVVGRLAWRAAVADLGIVDHPAFPVTFLLGVVVGVVVVALTVAGVPAWRASRRPPAEMLRAE